MTYFHEAKIAQISTKVLIIKLWEIFQNQTKNNIMIRSDIKQNC